MITSPDQKIYCSLDIEMTGFDPEEDEILEVGFCFFTMTENGAVVGERFNQLFKPAKPVSKKILGLTGITQAEIDQAPQFVDFKDYIQAQLQDAVIVGHSISTDIRFLSAAGIALSGGSIDTLELAQIILPTHHSYNLENLMHTFAVSHHAHRALGDAEATVQLLEKLIRVYAGFPLAARSQVQDILSTSSLLWKNWLTLPLEALPSPATFTLDKQKPVISLNTPEVHFQHDGWLLADAAQSRPEVVASSLAAGSDQYVLVLPHKKDVLKLWYQGLAIGVFLPEDCFSYESFADFVQHAQTIDEQRFAAKIAVWYHTNWQNRCLLDLNLTFFGGQFKQYISASSQDLPSAQALLACDYKTLWEYSGTQAFAGRRCVLLDPDSLEKVALDKLGNKISWGTILYTLKSVYNPETDFGRVEYKEDIIQLLAATDLLFGLVNIITQKYYTKNNIVSWTELQANSYFFNRLVKFIGSLADKLRSFAERSGVQEIATLADRLESFLTVNTESVQWLTFRFGYAAIERQPLLIAEQVKQSLSVFRSVTAVSINQYKPGVAFLARRLGISDNIDVLPYSSQFASELNLYSQSVHPSDIAHYLHTAQLPALVICNSQATIKKIYDDHFESLKDRAALIAEGYAGGTTKLFRNFSIRQETILLVLTDTFIVNNHYRLPAATVVIEQLPNPDTQHPYIQAMFRHYAPSMSSADLALIEVFRQFSAVTAGIKGQAVRTVHIYDQRLEQSIVKEQVGLQIKVL